MAKRAGGSGDYTPRVATTTALGRALLLAMLAWWTWQFVPHPRVMMAALAFDAWAVLNDPGAERAEA